ALTEINELCQEAVEISFHALAHGEQAPSYDSRQPFRGLSPFRAEEYRALGGVRQAITKTADRIYNELSAGEQDRMQDIFVRLTRLEENPAQREEWRNTRRRVGLDELVPADTDLAETKTLVKRLADAVLIVTSRDEVTGKEEVEVAHEALI